MRSLRLAVMGSLISLACLALVSARSQTSPATGSLEFEARVTPTAARAEPVRQFTFYLLTKSYAEIRREAEAGEALPSREKFIDDLKLSPQLKAWMKAHDMIDLSNSEIEQNLTPSDVVDTPEFLDAYMMANSGGVTRGLPKPKYTDAMKASDPAKYERLRKEYFAALKKFVETNPQTLGGMEAYMDGVNPARRWNQLAAAHRNRMSRRAPEIAQTRYLAAKTDTDLNGHGAFYHLSEGTYWLSTLDLDAAAGDLRLLWDVEVSVHSGQTTRVELTNLNGTERSQSAQ